MERGSTGSHSVERSVVRRTTELIAFQVAATFTTALGVKVKMALSAT
jgi:hypothetical protein